MYISRKKSVKKAYTQHTTHVYMHTLNTTGLALTFRAHKTHPSKNTHKGQHNHPKTVTSSFPPLYIANRTSSSKSCSYPNRLPAPADSSKNPSPGRLIDVFALVVPTPHNPPPPPPPAAGAVDARGANAPAPPTAEQPPPTPLNEKNERSEDAPTPPPTADPPWNGAAAGPPGVGGALPGQ